MEGEKDKGTRQVCLDSCSVTDKPAREWAGEEKSECITAYTRHRSKEQTENAV